MLHNDAEPLEASGYVLGDFTPRLFLPRVAGDGAGLGGYLHVCRGQVRYGWEKKGWPSKRGPLTLCYMGEEPMAREDINNKTNGSGQRPRLEPNEKALNGEWARGQGTGREVG